MMLETLVSTGLSEAHTSTILYYASTVSVIHTMDITIFADGIVFRFDDWKLIEAPEQYNWALGNDYDIVLPVIKRDYSKVTILAGFRDPNTSSFRFPGRG